MNNDAPFSPSERLVRLRAQKAAYRSKNKGKINLHNKLRHKQKSESERERTRAFDRKYYWQNKEKYRAKNRDWVKRNYEYTLRYRRNHNLKKNFGITLEQYEAMALSQNGLCAICGEKCKSGKKLAVDHCHKSKVVRSLLCGKCNLGIGYFDESVSKMRKAIEYILKHEEQRRMFAPKFRFEPEAEAEREETNVDIYAGA